MSPPRALAVPFGLGRPLGIPGNAAFQTDVLRAALGLLEANMAGPVLEFYDRYTPDQADDELPWSCPVTFVSHSDDESLSARVLGEMNLLRPWYEQSVAKKGSTTVGLSRMELTSIPGFLARFAARQSDIESPGGLSPADALKCAAEDLKAFYNEAAIAQPGKADARDIEHWYWNQCEAGNLIREIRNACREHPDPLVRAVASFTLVPQAQLSR